MPSTISQILLLLLGGLVCWMVLIRPYLGIVIIVASLPMVDLLTSLQISSSIFTIVGGVTLFSFIIDRLRTGRPLVRQWKLIDSIPLLFIVWITVTNPDAFSLIPGERNWFFTFLQLWILFILTHELIVTPRHQHVLMWAFVISCTISSAVGIATGEIAETIQQSSRSGGLAGGENTAARYFTVAVVFSLYLRSSITGRTVHRHGLVASVGILLLGIAYTASRTGLVLVFLAIFLILYDRAYVSRHKFLIGGFLGMILFLAVVPESYWDVVAGRLSSVTTKGDTMGTRYLLWDAGIKMWQDNPLTGVGIGEFPHNLSRYAPLALPRDFLGIGAHNLYVSLLAETGLIGLLLFCSFVGVVLAVAFRQMRNAKAQNQSLGKMWVVVVLVMLIGGIVKHDHYDKLLWFLLGTIAGMAQMSQTSISKHSVIKKVAHSLRLPSRRPLIYTHPQVRRPI